MNFFLAGFIFKGVYYMKLKMISIFWWTFFWYFLISFFVARYLTISLRGPVLKYYFHSEKKKYVFEGDNLWTKVIFDRKVTTLIYFFGTGSFYRFFWLCWNFHMYFFHISKLQVFFISDETYTFSDHLPKTALKLKLK